MAEKTPVVGIIMGSKSDLPTMEGCTAELERLGVPYELVIASAHRTPDKVHEWAATAADRGIQECGDFCHPDSGCHDARVSHGDREHEARDGRGLNSTS